MCFYLRSDFPCIYLTLRYRDIARQHAAASKAGPSTSNPPEDDRLHKMVILSVDMGWKTPEEGSRKKRKSRVVDEAMDVDAKPSEGVEEPKVCISSTAFSMTTQSRAGAP